MPLNRPVPFQAALEYLLRRELLPTSAKSAEIAQWAAEVRETSFFSAQNILEGVLKEIKSSVASIVNPVQVVREDRKTEENPEGFTTEGLNRQQAERVIKETLKKYGYEPEPGKKGSIQDLSSDRRVKLVVDMNVKMAQGAGQNRIRQEPDLLQAYPGWELFRAEDRKEKRNWHERAKAAAAETGSQIVLVGSEGVIALKNDPFWIKLSAFGLDHDPLDFNSGMERRDVHWKRMKELGFDLSVPIQPVTGIKLMEAA